MLLTSNAAFGFGQGVTGGARDQRVIPREREKQIVVNNKEELARTLTALGTPGTTKTVILLAHTDYSFSAETAFRIKAQNLTFQPLTTNRVKLKNLGLILDLASIDNILIRNLEFQSDGTTGPNDGIVFDGMNSVSDFTNRVRITHCTFHGYRDEAIEIRGHLSRVLATVDHCYFFDASAGRGDKFYNRGALNIAGLVLGGVSGNRSSSNSFVTVSYNYFENVWRRSPRVATDGTHAHIFNNLLYRWGYQKDGVTELASWNGMETELNFHQEGGAPATAVIQANRFIPWIDKQNKAIDPDAGTLVDIGAGTTLANRFDAPNGTGGNTALSPDGTFQTIDVAAWYTGLGLVAPVVMTTEAVDWPALAERAGTFVRPANSIPAAISPTPAAVAP